MTTLEIPTTEPSIKQEGDSSSKKKSILYIDVDDTLIAQCLRESFDLRPGVVTQIRILSVLFDCCWLTHWTREDLNSLWSKLYASRLIENVRYGDWRKLSRSVKSTYVLANNHDFYWLEDPLSTGNLNELAENNLMDRYIPVNPKGMWGFTRALRVLFTKAGIKNADIEAAGGNPKWFNEPLGDHFDWTYYE